MASSNKCGMWGNFIVGDPIKYKGKRARIVAAHPDDGIRGFVPIKIDTENRFKQNACIWVPEKDLERDNAWP